MRRVQRVEENGRRLHGYGVARLVADLGRKLENQELLDQPVGGVVAEFEQETASSS
jgi:hypothetical protein